MQLKSADNRQPQVDALTMLLARVDIPNPTRQRIEQEIRNIRAGQRAEKDAAYQIEFYAARNQNVMTIHDLRVSCNGRVAQIDHLIITRLFEFWVCESKRFAEGVEINDYGEWSARYGDERRGIPSPIEQNNRHIEVLRDVFASRLVALPKRSDHPVEPSFRGLVLVSDRTWIDRPIGDAASRVDGLDRVIKADQLRAKINSNRSASAAVVDRQTIEDVARQLVALHAPATIDFARRFGLVERTTESRPIGPGLSAGLGQIVFGDAVWRGENRSRPARSCEKCGDPVSEAVVDYCRDYAWLFENRILCVPCQDDIYPHR
jgi:hypothetical protein